MAAAYIRSKVTANKTQEDVTEALQLLARTQDLERMDRVYASAHDPHRTPLRLAAH
jgi:hypothetical protein